MKLILLQSKSRNIIRFKTEFIILFNRTFTQYIII
jgi:hypothetical protein